MKSGEADRSGSSSKAWARARESGSVSPEFRDRALASIVEAAEEAAVCATPDGTVLSWNRGAEQLFGASADEVVGRSIWELAQPELHDWIRRLLDTVVEGRGSARGEAERFRKNGSRFWAETSLSPIFDDDGNVVAVASVIRDISESKADRERLRLSEAMVRSVLETAADGIVTIGSDGIVQFFNEAATRIFGYEVEEIVGQSVNVLMLDPDRGRHDGYVRRYLETGESRIIGVGRELEARRKDGSTFPIHLALSEVPLEEGVIFVAIISDLSEIRRAQRMMDDFFDLSSDLLGIADSQGRLVRLNPAWDRILGRSPEARQGSDLLEFVHPDDVDSTRELFQRVVEGGEPISFENRYRCTEGPYRTFQWSVRSRPGLGLFAIGRDVTEQKEAEQDLVFRAAHDDVTGLLNRAAFREEFQRTLTRGARYQRRGALLYLDLDGFKAVNDAHGHTRGDHVLREIAERITACMREVDSAARLGGDEFAILLEEIGHDDDPCEIGERLIERLAVPFSVEGDEIAIGASIGVAVFPDDGDDCDILFEEGDAAMYEAKRRGGNRCVLYQPLVPDASRPRSL